MLSALLPPPPRRRRLICFLALLFVPFLQADALSSGTRSLTTADLPPLLQQAASRGLLAQPRGRPNVHVLGTVHIGSRSAEEASLLINAVKPVAVVVEVAPSRLETIRRRNEAKAAKQKNDDNKKCDIEESPSIGTISSSRSSSSLPVLLQSLPALAQKGWSTGGIGGALFAIAIVWGSLLKRSLTADEESDTLPRVDEFAAAIDAADAIGSSVIPCDVEIDRLIGDAASSLSPIGWLSLGINIAAETVGIRDTDPLRRKRGESIVEWAERRRDNATARASRLHGENMCAGLSRVVVDKRDERFAAYCRKVIELSKDTSSTDELGSIVCVVGLAHLDGVVKRLEGASNL